MSQIDSCPTERRALREIRNDVDAVRGLPLEDGEQRPDPGRQGSRAAEIVAAGAEA